MESIETNKKLVKEMFYSTKSIFTKLIDTADLNLNSPKTSNLNINPNEKTQEVEVRKLTFI